MSLAQKIQAMPEQIPNQESTTGLMYQIQRLKKIE
jgi:hypothetical protein